MSARINQAVNQVRLTNVAIVRLKRGGKRFEIGCYRNKVVNWRNKVETDIDEVLQIDRVFENVSKGVLAKNKDLQKAFGTTDQEAVCRIILKDGALQVSDKEREVHQENLFKDIATVVAQKCVNPRTQRPYPVDTVISAMKTAHYAVVPSKSAKQQSLDVIRLLKKVIPIERAKMSLNISVGMEEKEALKTKLVDMGVSVKHVEEDEKQKKAVFNVHSKPENYRILSKLVSKMSLGSIDVQDYSVQEQGEADVEDAVHQQVKPEVTKSAETQAKQETNLSPGDSKEKTGLKCTTCLVYFGTDTSLQRQHYKCELHRINLKLKMKKLPVLTEDMLAMMDQSEKDGILYDYS